MSISGCLKLFFNYLLLFEGRSRYVRNLKDKLNKINPRAPLLALCAAVILSFNFCSITERLRLFCECINSTGAPAACGKGKSLCWELAGVQIV